jgi:nitroimidazol reductase NimA-like FMN-containing flavoprotein (pyridoxamine 5'-phosphate oxidase superfamily)
MTDERGGRGGSIREIPESECRELLTSTTVGRIAFVDADGQQILPVNFVLIDGDIYIRTLPGGVIDTALSPGHDEVAFEIDHQDVFRIGWNVTVRGSAAGVEDPATIDAVLANERLHPWAGGDRLAVVKVSPRMIAGRRVIVR